MDSDRYKVDKIPTLECEGEKFFVLKSIVCKHSPVLSKACNGHFEEASTDVISVTQFNAKTLRRMLEFMYEGKYEASELEKHEELNYDNYFARDEHPEEATLEDKIAALEICEVSSTEEDEPPTYTILDMLQPHILVNSISDYYDVPGLKSQANQHVCDVLENSWSASDFMAAAELTFASTSDTELYAIITAAINGHIKKLLDREDFLGQGLLNPYSITSYVEDCKTLAALRLVDKAFCRSASRGLFRRVILEVGYKPAITTKFQALASSEYAQFVREAVFSPDPIFKHTRWRPKFVFAPNILTRLTSVLKKLPKLETVAICPLPWDPTLSWSSVALRAIADLKHHNVTRLEMSLDNSAYLKRCIECRQEKPVTQLIRQVQHLKLYGKNEEEDDMDDLHLILKTAANLVSLEVNSYCSVYGSSVKEYNFHQHLQLKSLNLVCVSITSYELLGLLEWCKDTIKSVAIGFLALNAGSWLHVLMQIKKNLKLLKFFFNEWNISRAKETEYGNYMWRSLGKFRRDHELIGCAIGDLQRQTNANRIAEGLRPLSKEEYRELDLPTLESAIDDARYTELISRSWDAEKDATYEWDTGSDDPDD
ncbi:uncharacterized protein BHQ10_006542 [Talaromyces amestolkiae]|uniref:BTB domain-containing protein n=1 Tax=Talaromyces amestolkiae TaxID=1196081 RepID=A0A364L3Z1_TALAM|nr:uncharacterized protein BHQ10_006542 [Talaromyces amestolkiae]RAO70530.1 hypothetical protein BHQ10_006542 [Talaromyces amestolkiae]